MILECALPRKELQRGDIKTVVLVHREGKVYEVDLLGETVAVVTLWASQIRPAHNRAIAHARDLARYDTLVCSPSMLSWFFEQRMGSSSFLRSPIHTTVQQVRVM